MSGDGGPFSNVLGKGLGPGWPACAPISPEVPLLLCHFSFSKCTPCRPHSASSASTFACAFAQLAKLEEAEKSSRMKPHNSLKSPPAGVRCAFE